LALPGVAAAAPLALLIIGVRIGHAGLRRAGAGFGALRQAIAGTGYTAQGSEVQDQQTAPQPGIEVLHPCLLIATDPNVV